MTTQITERTILVALPESVVSALLKMNASLEEGLAASLQNPIKDSTIEPAERKPEPGATTCSISHARKYSAEFLGVTLTSWTLPEIFARIVNMTAIAAPEALDKLAAMRARKRRFVARNSETLHPSRPDLAVRHTASGWWISKNIGQEDLKRALKALAQAADLRFGEDVKFPSQSGSGRASGPVSGYGGGKPWETPDDQLHHRPRETHYFA